MADTMPGSADQDNPGREKTEFAKRNPFLEKLIPDAIENAVDAMLPDRFEKLLDRGCENVAAKYQNFTTDISEAYGEVAGVLLKVAKYAWEKFGIGDVLFGVYHLAQHHAATQALDAVKGRPVSDPKLVEALLYAADLASWSYCPTKEELSKASGVPLEDIPIMVPDAETNRPAYAVAIDHSHKTVVWGFRGTTDLEDMLTDACAACVPYCGGYAHWGMLEAAKWMVANELERVVGICREHPGYKLLLVGHSLGAGTATLLAHLLRHDAEAGAVLGDIPVTAVGVATPAVLTKDLAEGCSGYITSLVLMHDVVPRFSIHNVFAMKEEMDATEWGDKIKATVQDWAVPDVIENSKAWQKLRVRYKLTKRRWRLNRKRVAGGLTPVITNKMENMLEALAAFLVTVASWFTTLLHFMGLVNPNKQLAAGAGAGAAVAAGSSTPGKTGLEQVEAAAERISDRMEHLLKDDVQEVYAPGRLFFLLREDPPSETAQGAAAAAGATPAEAAAAEASQMAPVSSTAEEGNKEGADVPYPGAKFELIEGQQQQRFKRIVLRDTCLKDHLTGGYLQGLRYTLDKLQGK